MGVDMLFLKKYGVEGDISILLATDIASFTMSQRALSPVPVYDVHDAYSNGYEVGVAENNQGITIGSFLHIVTFSFMMKDKNGNIFNLKFSLI